MAEKIEKEVTPKQHKISKKPLIIFLVFLSITLLLLAGYFFYQYRNLSKSLLLPQLKNQEESLKLATSVGRLMLLPKDEVPTVANITDITALKDQLFFKNADNGNKVLIYPNSKLAIIYDPQANIIINVGPINFAEQQNSQISKPRIGLRNGTNVVGITYQIESTIQKAFPETNIVLKDKSSLINYEKTIVAVLNSGFETESATLSKFLNVQVAKLPEGETKPEGVDILIIVGKDKI